jgi:hypothetical protein
VCSARTRAENPSVSDTDVVKIAKAMMPGIQDEARALSEEIFEQALEEELDNTCFVYGAEKRIVLDEELRRMSAVELAAWCREGGVMFAQVRAHLAERYPETERREGRMTEPDTLISPATPRGDS